MEPITHFLTGACLARAGFNRKTALATATMTIAAEAPDLDVFAQVRGPIFGFAHHRGFTHSFLGLLPVAAVTVGIIYIVWRIRGGKLKNPKLPPRWGLLFVFSYLAGLTHILLDFTNQYGVRPFWPFSERWYAWDIVFIIEPVLYIFLLGALLLPVLFALINEEIGARRKGPQGRLAAILALAGMVALYGLRDYEHRRAVSALQSRLYEDADPIRVSAFPFWWNPFEWYGVVETRSFFATMLVNSLTPEVDPQSDMQLHYKPEETPVTVAAKKSYVGRVYLDWARYPLTETEQIDSPQPGYIVRFQDLRFDYPGRVSKVLRASVELDGSLKVVKEQWGIGQPRAPAD